MAPMRPERQMTAPGEALTDRRVTLIANPAAGGYRETVLSEIADTLKARDTDVDIRLTEQAGDILACCSDPNVSADTIVIAGGDGSLNEAVRGLRASGADRKLALIPFGTANVMAHEFKLPFDAAAISKMILRGRTAPLHYGLADDAPFVLMASAGFDADVVHHVPLDLKRRLGKAAYVWTALKRLRKPRGGMLKVTVNGKDEIICRLAVVTNSRHYGGPFVLCPEAHATQPGLRLVAITSDSPLSILRFGFSLALNRISKSRNVTERPVETVTIEGERTIPCQVDGDPYGVTPVTITAAAEPVRFIVP